MKIAVKKDDITNEIDGTWVDYGDSKLLIARLGNPRNRKAYDRAQNKYKAKARKGTLSPDERVEITARTLSESILLDWEGISGMDGKPLEYSTEMAFMALRWDIDLRTFVSEQADLSENFRAAEVDEDAGKSQAGLSGKSKTATK